MAAKYRRRCRRDRITIQSPIKTETEYGQEKTTSWASVAGLVNLHAEFEHIGGTETFRGRQVEAGVNAVFEIRTPPVAIDPRFRVLCGDKAYEIISIRPVEHQYEGGVKGFWLFTKSIESSASPQLADWSPSGLSPYLWFDAADKDSTSFPQWKDKSGNDFHLSSTDILKFPALMAWGENQCYSFDGIDDRLIWTPFQPIPQKSQSRYWFAVVDTTDTPEGNYQILVSGDTNTAIYVDANNNLRPGWYASGWHNSEEQVTGKALIEWGITPGQNVTIRVNNGATKVSATSENYEGAWLVMGGDAVGSHRAKYKIGEVLAFPEEPEDRDSLIEYLRLKWGLPL